MSINFKYTVSLDDYKAGLFFHAESSIWLYLTYVTTRFAMPVIGAIVIAESVFLLVTNFSRPLAAALLFLGIVMALYPIFYRHRIKRFYERTRTGNNECNATFSEDLIHVESADSSSDVKWTAIKSFSENNKVLLLYLAPAKFLILPKREFQPGQVEELRSMLQRKLS